MKKFGPPIVAALVGWLGGVRFERLNNKHEFKFDLAVDKASCLQSTLPTVTDSNIIKNQVEKTPIETIMKFGFPSFDNIRAYENFVLSYDRRNRTSNWVFEHLTPKLLNKDLRIDRNKCEFFEDESIDQIFRSTNKDYFKSGYDRGHLAPAGNHQTSQNHCQQTFILSNISPQVGNGFNRGIWNKLERYVRYRARKMKNTWSCTGPLYLPRFESDGRKYIKYEVIGDNDVSVPTHFFKVLVFEDDFKNFDLEAYVIQNKSMDENIPLKAFQVPINSIERAAGFILFEKLPRNTFRSINGPNPYLEKFTASYKKSKSSIISH